MTMSTSACMRWRFRCCLKSSIIIGLAAPVSPSKASCGRLFCGRVWRAGAGCDAPSGAEYRRAALERSTHRRNARHGFRRAAGVDQHHTGFILQLRPLALTAIGERQNAAGGDMQRAAQAKLIRSAIQLGIQIGFLQHAASTERRPVIDHAVGAGHHCHARCLQLRQWHRQLANRNR